MAERYCVSFGTAVLEALYRVLRGMPCLLCTIDMVAAVGRLQDASGQV